MKWNEEDAVIVDREVRVDTRHTRAMLHRFVAEEGWRALPSGYKSPDEYIMDVTGYASSEANRQKHTATISRFVLVELGLDGLEDTLEHYEWLLRDVFKNTHIATKLAQDKTVLTLVPSTYQEALSLGNDPSQAVITFLQSRVLAIQEQAKSDPQNESPDEMEAGASSVPQIDYPSAAAASILSEGLPAAARAARVVECPHCNAAFEL